MADPPPQSAKPQNPNWGGRCKGSGRKKNMSELTELPKAPVNITLADHTYHISIFFSFSSLSTGTTHLPGGTSTPARGFFAPHNCFQDPNANTSAVNTSVTTDREQGAINQAKGV
jgi:hypothetical protein